MIQNFETGLIIKINGGLFTVKTQNAIFKCSAKGVFRKQSKIPFVGDYVDIETENETTGVIFNIHKRKNSIIRPPTANIDNLFIVSSATKPLPNTLILDKLFAIASYYDINAVLIITKIDLKNADWLYEIYNKSGFEVINFCVSLNKGIEQLNNSIKGKINLFIGNTGVGKSTTLNGLNMNLDLKTDDISEKLGRGKHTTRYIELFETKNGGYIGDTPGFSTVDLLSYGITDKENLQFCFNEFKPLIGKCKYTGCSHTKESGCLILKAVEEGFISESRHKSYCIMYNELKDIKQWDIKKSN